MISKKLALAFALFFIVAFSLGYCIAILTTQYKISNLATIKTIGVTVYSDQNCTQRVTSINWGILEPNSSKTITIYVVSTSNTAITLTIYTENWNPINCTDYMTLTASPNNIQMQPSEIRQISLTLTVASNIQGIIDFTFDIMLNGSG